MWGSTGRKSSRSQTPDPSQLKEQKQKQITSLFTYHNHVKELTPERQYELPCSAGSLEIAFLINLPPEFPLDPPVITVTPSDLRHPWIEFNVVTGLEKLQAKNWTVQNNLGKVLQEICDEFTRSPPIRSAQAETVEDDWVAVTSPISSRPPPPIPPRNDHTSNSTQFQSSIHESLSVTPALEATIKSKTNEELEELLSNDAAFEMFFQQLERVQQLKTVQEELRSGNEALAKRNLGVKDDLVKLQEEVSALDAEWKEHWQRYQESDQQQQAAFNRFSTANIIARLRAAAMECDDLSESVAQSFLDGSLDHDTFVKQFRDLRKVYHLRASKVERGQRNDIS
ncbi:hypothetical protein INT43_003182 [Umbelopsis isabellina]|uniref:VPS37 C-terminal domain-containing protein n=1 Tax=Mortierella isabellina TaxID=91625 RepID=A0A8H7UCJ1_MORIS|nr:hypothetical protein INT43_003182 [Umbelopsis isabellina]